MKERKLKRSKEYPKDKIFDWLMVYFVMIGLTLVFDIKFDILFKLNPNDISIWSLLPGTLIFWFLVYYSNIVPYHKINKNK